MILCRGPVAAPASLLYASTMTTDDVEHVLIDFSNKKHPDVPPLILEREDLDKLLASPLVKAYADNFVKART